MGRQKNGANYIYRPVITQTVTIMYRKAIFRYMHFSLFCYCLISCDLSDLQKPDIANCMVHILRNTNLNI